MKTKLILSTLLLGAIISCKKDDPVEPVITNEQEVITTLNYTLTNSNDATEVITLSFVDIDGDGGNDPIITGGTLNANTIYNGSIELLNETETPAEDVTEEIQEEDEDHQFFFHSDTTILHVDYADVDGNGNPIGLSTLLSTFNAGSDTLTITLKHEPTKPNDGTLASAGGETDIEVSFPINVQ